MAESFTQEAREILLDWQRKGMKFLLAGTPTAALSFDTNVRDYYIPLQSLPEGFYDWSDYAQLCTYGLNVVDATGGVFDYAKGVRGAFIAEQPIPFWIHKGHQDGTYAPRVAERITEATGTEVHAVHHEGEHDPFGLDAHEPGAKLDAGKNRVALVMRGFSRALTEVGRVGTYGADKYTPNGWVKVGEGIERYDDATMRHWLEGRKVDKETGLLHAAQVAWNALAVLELMLIEEEDQKCSNVK